MLDNTVETVNEAEHQNGRVSRIDGDSDRKEKLKDLIKVGSEKLTDEEKSQICDASVCLKPKTCLHLLSSSEVKSSE